MSATAPDARDHVGPYLVLRAIGAGGSARIDLARIDRAYNFQRHVVIKRPLEHLRGDPSVAASLQREARIGGRLRHPNLVAVLDAGMHDDYDYLALEYIHGTSLRALMQTETGGQVRDVPLAVALGIVTDVCRALHAAHELTDDRGEPLGLVHRDVSPGNVLLGLDGAVKLADFGIAKETRVATLSGSMHGTVTYMAPEQCRGHAFDRRADIFSIGVILYELVTHQRLFWADNDVASLHRVLSGQVTPPRKVEPAISVALEQLVMTAIAQQPEQRFGSARQLADAIEGLSAAEGHVLGARWLARTLEEQIGPKHAPWIAATTIVQQISLPPAEESLVNLIAQAAEPDEPIYSTFGPMDERSLEEGELPQAPATPGSSRAITASNFRPAPVPRTQPAKRRWLSIVVLGAATGIAAAFVLSMLSKPPPAAATPPVTPPAVLVAAPKSTPAVPSPPTAPVVDTKPTAQSRPPEAGLHAGGLKPELTTSRAKPNKKTGKGRQTSAAATGSDRSPAVPEIEPPPVVVQPPPPQPAASGSANPVWGPGQLLPTDPAAANKP